MKFGNERGGLTNLFGALGYMLLVVTWVFFVAVLFTLLLERTGSSQPIDAIPSASDIDSARSTTPNMFIVVASYIITGVMVVVTAAILVTLPYFVGKWGSKITKAFMKAGHIDSTKRQLFLVKSSMVIVPSAVLTGVQLVYRSESLTFAVMFGAVVGAAVLAIVSFLVQLLFARRVGLSFDEVW